MNMKDAILCQDWASLSPSEQEIAKKVSCKYCEAPLGMSPITYGQFAEAFKGESPPVVLCEACLDKAAGGTLAGGPGVIVAGSDVLDSLPPEERKEVVERVLGIALPEHDTAGVTGLTWGQLMWLQGQELVDAVTEVMQVWANRVEEETPELGETLRSAVADFLSASKGMEAAGEVPTEADLDAALLKAEAHRFNERDGQEPTSLN
jgi:hypothetical protein